MGVEGELEGRDKGCTSDERSINTFNFLGSRNETLFLRFEFWHDNVILGNKLLKEEVCAPYFDLICDVIGGKVVVWGGGYVKLKHVFLLSEREK